MELSIRALLSYTKDDVVELPDTVTLIYEDDVAIPTSIRRVVYMYYIFEIFRHYPMAPILSKHSLEVVLGGKPLTSNTHIKILEIIYKDVVTIYQLEKPKEREHLWKLLLDTTNIVYNEITQLAEAYVASIDILDFVNIVTYPPVMEAVSQVTGSQQSIADCYEIIANILRSDPNLDHNAIAEVVRADMVSIGQVLQCVSPRGRMTEVDGTILPIPVMSNYTEGLGSLYEYAAESRSAAKSLYFSDAKLQDAEYFARRLQLLCMVVDKIDYIDCGSTKTIDWHVMPPSYDEHGRKTYLGDLAFMEGKYYIEDHQLKLITHDDPALYNKTLKLRTVLYCNHPDPHQVCEICFGRLSKNVSAYSNLGHLCAATMTRQSTQSVLSIKHLDRSAAGTTISLNEVSSQYFKTDDEGMLYYMNLDMQSKQPKLVLNRDSAIGLVDILHMDTLDTLNPVRISSIECLEIITRDKDVETAMVIYVSQGNKKVMMTIDFLKYLKTHHWDMDSRNNFIFDLKHWDFNKPLFKLPEMEYSFSDHSDMIAKVIESNMKSIADREQPYSPVSTLQELFSLVNTKIRVNIAALEVIIYSAMVKAPGEFALGRNVEEPVMGIADQIIKNRSLGAAYSYQDTAREMINPQSFFKLDRPDSVFDVFMMPQEYLDANPDR